MSIPFACTIGILGPPNAAAALARAAWLPSGSIVPGPRRAARATPAARAGDPAAFEPLRWGQRVRACACVSGRGGRSRSGTYRGIVAPQGPKRLVAAYDLSQR